MTAPIGMEYAAVNEQEVGRFAIWLAAQGAEVLAPTNPFEVVRFRAKGGTHVIYRRKNGGLTIQKVAGEALDHFRRGARWNAGYTQSTRNGMGKHKAALVERDGDCCWFCGLKMAADEMTVEHLVARGKGGPDHMDNLVLAHARCNKAADNLPLVEKIKLHVAARKP